MSILSKDYYQTSNAIKLAKDLLGKVISSEIDNKLCSGRIVETEAYMAPEDKASHAYGMKRTKRTETMFLSGGRSYVYLCYGMYHLFNIVSGKADVPHAILVSAIEPLQGIDQMLKRRGMLNLLPNVSNGPGKLSQALGITKKDNDIDLAKGKRIWISDDGIRFKIKETIASPRVNIGYAQEYISKPWRFRVMNSKWTSRAK